MTLAPTSPGFSTTVEALRLCEWRLGPGEPTLVLDQFTAEDFHLVVDDRGDVHVNSTDGRFYVGWFPFGRPGTDGEGGKIAVTGTAKTRGYSISFDVETPATFVAAAVGAILETSRRVLMSMLRRSRMLPAPRRLSVPRSEMTVGDLIDLLSAFDRTSWVRLAMNPFFPMAHCLARVVPATDRSGRTVIYLAEGRDAETQLGHLPPEIAVLLCWQSPVQPPTRRPRRAVDGK